MTISDEKRDAYHDAHTFNMANPVGSPVLAWPGTRNQEPLRTRTRSSAWVLPADDVVVQVNGHSGGIALTHIEPDPTRQPAVPEIEFRPPDCPICGTELQCDGDGFDCSACNASWGTDGRSGQWADPDALRCPATRTWGSEDLPDEQCVLADSHEDDNHRLADGYSEWTDAHYRAVIDSDGERIGGEA